MTKKGRTEDVSEAQALTAGEVARWLRIPKSTLYKLCHEGEIPTTKIGRYGASTEPWSTSGFGIGSGWVGFER